MSDWKLIHENFHTKHSVFTAPYVHKHTSLRNLIQPLQTQRERGAGGGGGGGGGRGGGRVIGIAIAVAGHLWPRFLLWLFSICDLSVFVMVELNFF